MDDEDLLKDMRGLSIWPSVEDELRDIFDAIVKMYRQWEAVSDSSQHRLSLRSLCLRSMQNTSRIYQQNMPFTGERINFSDIFTRWSYMFVFMPCHIYLVFYSLDHVVRERILAVNPSVRPPSICMIGGGPGSDILGIEIVLMKHGITTPLFRKVHVLDKCSDWAKSWGQLHKNLPERYRKWIPKIQYQQFDYLENKLTREQLSCIQDADIVTMIKSLSPAAAWLKSKRKSYKYMVKEARLTAVISEWHSVYEILKAMKPGALLLYIDNETGPQRQILMDTVNHFNTDILFNKVLNDVRMPNNVISVSSRRLINAFDYRPCTNAGSNEVIILTKE